MIAGPGDSSDLPGPRRGLGQLVLAVTAAWVVIAVVIGAQASFAATLAGGPAAPLGPAVGSALIQTVPWIPVSLAIVALALRFPLPPGRRLAHALIHLGAAVALTFVVNLLVVLLYWALAGAFKGLGPLLEQGARWTVMRLHLGLTVYLAVLAITLAARYYRDSRDRELRLARLEGQLARARLQALTAQMRPHFLFNTLHTIGQLWRRGADDEAEAALDHLGSLFHRVQRSTQTLQIPLGDELAMVEEYLAIEQARFPDRLSVLVRAPDEALSWQVPPLILQPLVENAVRHGISARAAGGRVEVTGELANGGLRLLVRDDGPGLDAPTPQPGSGTGLANTRERLEQLHGGRARLDLESTPDRGTLVTVWLPGPAR